MIEKRAGVPDLQMACPYCSGQCVNSGRTAKHAQRYRCKSCKRYGQRRYVYNACQPEVSIWVVNLTKESCGIRSISRLLGISPTTVIKRILQMAKKMKKPPVPMGKTYEMDELKTYVRNKGNEQWVIYAMDRKTRQVVDMKVGKRNKKNLKKVIETLLLAKAKMVYTDRLDLYRYILPESIHGIKVYGTNHIERKNLTLRTHLKRLGRKTICYSKSLVMLEACLMLYFWGERVKYPVQGYLSFL